MIEWLTKTLRLSRKRDADLAEREKIARLENAEQQLRDLQVRGDRAVQYLSSRHGRNHWREAIELMIQGAS